MVTYTDDINELDKIIKRKWIQINWRTGNAKSYIRNGITNDFSSYDEFRNHAIEQGIEKGFHSHRPDRTKGYSVDNLVFIPEEEHRRITNSERRKLSDDEVRIIRDASNSDRVTNPSNLATIIPSLSSMNVNGSEFNPHSSKKPDTLSSYLPSSSISDCS